eukprot:PhM_4_TR15792/c0_g1_i1/m.43761
MTLRIDLLEDFNSIDAKPDVCVRLVNQSNCTSNSHSDPPQPSSSSSFLLHSHLVRMYFYDLFLATNNSAFSEYQSFEMGAASLLPVVERTSADVFFGSGSGSCSGSYASLSAAVISRALPPFWFHSAAVELLRLPYRGGQLDIKEEGEPGHGCHIVALILVAVAWGARPALVAALFDKLKEALVSSTERLYLVPLFIQECLFAQLNENSTNTNVSLFSSLSLWWQETGRNVAAHALLYQMCGGDLHKVFGIVLASSSSSSSSRRTSQSHLVFQRTIWGPLVSVPAPTLLSNTSYSLSVAPLREFVVIMETFGIESALTFWYDIMARPLSHFDHDASFHSQFITQLILMGQRSSNCPSLRLFKSIVRHFSSVLTYNHCAEIWSACFVFAGDQGAIAAAILDIMAELLHPSLFQHPTTLCQVKVVKVVSDEAANDFVFSRFLSVISTTEVFDCNEALTRIVLGNPWSTSSSSVWSRTVERMLLLACSCRRDSTTVRALFEMDVSGTLSSVKSCRLRSLILEVQQQEEEQQHYLKQLYFESAKGLPPGMIDSRRLGAMQQDVDVNASCEVRWTRHRRSSFVRFCDQQQTQKESDREVGLDVATTPFVAAGHFPRYWFFPPPNLIAKRLQGG